jgi:glycosyltransferase involved in cell wall biosynthesis
MKMTQAFKKEGHDVTLFAPKAADFDGDLSALWERYGIDVPFPIQFIKGWKPLRWHDIALQSAWKARRAHAEVVFARSVLQAMYASWFGIPTIFDAHGPPGTRMAKLYLQLLFSGRGFRRLSVVTNTLKSVYLESYPRQLTPDQVVVDPNGIDIEQFASMMNVEEARKRLNLSQRFTVGYAGHMYPGRGVDLIIELAKRMPDIQFLLIGGTDSDIAHWRAHAYDYDITNMLFMGFVPNGSLPDYYAACDVLLMPYQRTVAVYGGVGDSAAYMSPMKMFEYMASERLIVSSDLPVLHDVLSENNAVLCNPENVSQWRAAIERAMNNPDWAREVAKQARRDVARYTWIQRARRLLDGVS